MLRAAPVLSWSKFRVYPVALFVALVVSLAAFERAIMSTPLFHSFKLSGRQSGFSFGLSLSTLRLLGAGLVPAPPWHLPSSACASLNTHLALVCILEGGSAPPFPSPVIVGRASKSMCPPMCTKLEME